MFLRNYVAQLLICVVFEENKHTVRARSTKNGRTVKSYEKSFEDKKKLLQYIDNLSSNFQLYYISVFCESLSQGLVPAGVSEFSRFGVEKNVISLSLLNASIYTSKSVIKEYQKLFENYGEVDLIYSPFMLLYHCINKTKSFKNKTVLYVFRHSIYLTLMICEAKNVLFGKFYDINTHIDASENAENLEHLDEEINFDEPEQDSVVSEELESLIKEDSESPSDDARELVSSAMNLSHFGSDMNMCSCIFEGVQEFYTNALYKGKFIDELVLFDNAEINQAVLDYVEGEIFIKPQVIKVDTFALMNELMRKELDL